MVVSVSVNINSLIGSVNTHQTDVYYICMLILIDIYDTSLNFHDINSGVNIHYIISISHYQISRCSMTENTHTHISSHITSKPLVDGSDLVIELHRDKGFHDDEAC